MHHHFVYTKEISKNTKENFVRSLSFKNVYIYLFVSAHLIGQHSWSSDELNDTHLEAIACKENCMCMQFFAKLHAHATEHAIVYGMQFWQEGCHSTRLDFRNAVLWDGHSQANKYIHFCKIKIRLDFPLYCFKFTLYIKNGGALKGKSIYNHNHYFAHCIYGPYTATFSKSEKVYFWNTLLYNVQDSFGGIWKYQEAANYYEKL